MPDLLLPGPFPKTFIKFIRDIFKRMFRCFAIIYHTSQKSIAKAEATIYLKRCFRHFMFFVYEFKLVEPGELKALPSLALRLYKEYKGLTAQRKVSGSSGKTKRK